MSIDDVRALVAERQRYDDWLTALETRRGNTPARVFERVHADYAGRRSAVMEQLSGHIDTLAGMSQELHMRLSALDESLAAHEDEHVEAMLRTAVGEFDADRWEHVRQEVEARIAGVSTERSTLVTELDDVRALLASARNETPVALSSTAAGGNAGSVDELQSADATSPGSGANDVIFTGTTLTDSLALNGSGTENASAVVSEQGTGMPADEGSGSERLPSGDALDLDDALALFTPPSEPAANGNGNGKGSSDAPAPAEKDNDPFDDLAFLRSVIDPAEGGSATRGASTAAPVAAPQKTLRCTECSTMNLPTEWYCERCGGELAAF
ncbi:MAG TPA: hypothetical protein VE869_12105, partial [Gemmatimonas sp.]|nr:hypothetical protein [Gemmatimonas sp.]